MTEFAHASLTVNDVYEGWLGCANSTHSRCDAAIKMSAHSAFSLLYSHQSLYHSPVSSTPSSRDWSNRNMLLQRQRATLPGQMVWISGYWPRGVHRIQLQSITDKHSPVKKLFPLKWWNENKSRISPTGPSRVAHTLLCLLNPSESTICYYILANKISAVHTLQRGRTFV